MLLKQLIPGFEYMAGGLSRIKCPSPSTPSRNTEHFTCLPLLSQYYIHINYPKSCQVASKGTFHTQPDELQIPSSQPESEGYVYNQV